MTKRLEAGVCEEIQSLLEDMNKIRRPRGLLLRTNYPEDPRRWNDLIAEVNDIARRWERLLSVEQVAGRLPHTTVPFLPRMGSLLNAFVRDKNYSALRDFIDIDIKKIARKLDGSFKNDLDFHDSHKPGKR